MGQTEFTFIDVGAFAIFAAVWLGPLCLTLLRHKVRLIHPNFCIPVPVVYLTCVALNARLQGVPMLQTSRLYSSDEWFLAGPMVFMSFMGMCYHLGVRLSGLPTVCVDRDSVAHIISLPSFRNTPIFGIVLSVGIAFCLSIVARLISAAGSETGQGIWIFHTFSRCFLFLPLFVLPVSNLWGTMFVITSFAEALLFPSKATFANISFILMLFFQERLLGVSRTLTALVVSGILLTPVAVALYRQTYADAPGTTGVDIILRHEDIRTKDWSDAADTLRHREYAFEAFAIVFQHYLDSPLRLGTETLVELSYFIPFFLWPEKPLLQAHFAEQFLPFELAAYGGNVPGITMYFLTPYLLDWGLFGCAIFVVGVGLFWGYAYKTARNLSLATGESWPIVLYLPLPFITHPFLGGGVPFAATTVMGIGTGLVTTIILVRFFQRVS